MNQGLQRLAQWARDGWAWLRDQLGRRERVVLRPSVSRLRETRRIAGIGDWTWNLATGEVGWSEETYAIHGLSPGSEPLHIAQIAAGVHPDDQSRMAADMEAMLIGLPPRPAEYRIRRPDGSERVLLSRSEVTGSGEHMMVRGTIQDVTDMALMREELAKAQADYRQLFDFSPLPMWVVDQQSLELVEINRTMVDWYGYSRDELVGQPFDFLLVTSEKPKARAITAARDYRQGRVWTHRRKDGGRLRVATHYHDVVFQGRQVWLVTAQDITEREQNEDRFRAIALASSDAAYDYDVATSRLWWGEGLLRTFGYQPAQMASLAAYMDHVHPNDRAEVMSDFTRKLQSEVTEVSQDYRLRHANGRYLHIHARGLIARDEQGRPLRVTGSLTDVSMRRRSEEELRLLRRAVEASHNALLIVDARAQDMPVVWVNSAFEKITGYSAADMLGRNCRMLQGCDREQRELGEIRLGLKEARDVQVLLRNYRKDGTLFWNELLISPVRDEVGAVSHFVGAIHDVSERHRYEEQLAHRATHDELTGLPNRVLLEDRLQQALLGVDRYGGCAGVVFIDLDDFKLINDTLGHGTGDTVLREVANRLQVVVRASDTVGRFGGDEFVVVLGEHSDADSIAAIVGRIVECLHVPLSLPINGGAHTLTASIGYCRYPEDGSDVQQLLMRADLAMYEAKSRGRDRAVRYRPEFDEGVSQRLQLLAQLREAIGQEQFVLLFQPLFAGEGRLLALEALVRWQHPTRGLLPPAEFVSLCEDNGLIGAVGRWVLREAARHHVLLQQAGLGEVRMSVNISAAQFNDELVADVQSVLAEFALPSGALELELTESVIMGNPEQAIDLMQRLVELGVGFSVDDFGTGYSSLAYLKRFPIERLKIDRSFVHDLNTESDDASVCQLIIAMAHSLGIRTVAEGVETAPQLEWLRARDCDEVQGYLFGRPQPFAVLLPQLRRLHAGQGMTPPPSSPPSANSPSL